MLAANKLKQETNGRGNQVVVLAIGSSNQVLAAYKHRQQTSGSSKQLVAMHKLVASKQ